jgi:hypothetical protein
MLGNKASIELIDRPALTGWLEKDQQPGPRMASSPAITLN